MKPQVVSRKRFVRSLFFLLVFAFVFFVFFYLPLNRLLVKVRTLSSLIKPTKDAVLLQDLPLLSENLQMVGSSLASLEKEYGRLFYLGFIPFLGSYYGDGRQIIKAADGLVLSGEALVQRIIPFSAKLGFKGGDPKEPIVGGQERLVGVVKAAPVLADNYKEIGEGIHQARLALEKVNPRRYPETFMGKGIRSKLNTLKDLTLYLDEASADVKDLLSEIPSLLGEPKKVSYLILFQNDKEIRPTGGFLTAYAIFTLERGRIISVTSGDIYFLDIDNRVPFYPPAPEVIQKYLKIKDWYIRDSNLSPDFKVSAQTVEEFWNRVPGVPKVDGMIAIDTHFVESVVGVLGDVSLPGYEKFTKDNITYQLEVFATVIGSKLEKRGGRKDLIGVLMQHIMQKAFSQSTKQYGQFIAKVWQEAEEKHLLLYLHSERAQNLAEKYNFAGRIIEAEGDYLHVNDANFAGRKANWYIKENVVKNVEKKDGKIINTLTITYENTGDYHPDFNTGYRDYVRVYTPAGSKLLSADGSLNGTEKFEELGKTVFASYMAVDPKKKATLTIKYELREDLLTGNTYNLLVQKQPGTDRFEYEVKVGRKSEKFELRTDTTVEMRF